METEKPKIKNKIIIYKEVNPFFHYFLEIYFIITLLIGGLAGFVFYKFIFPHLDSIREVFVLVQNNTQIKDWIGGL